MKNVTDLVLVESTDVHRRRSCGDAYDKRKIDYFRLYFIILSVELNI